MRRTLLIAMAGVLLTGGPAQAYIDPGTTGMISSLLLGGVAGALAIVKIYWRAITDFFRRRDAGS